MSVYRRSDSLLTMVCRQARRRPLVIVFSVILILISNETLGISNFDFELSKAAGSNGEAPIPKAKKIPSFYTINDHKYQDDYLWFIHLTEG
jgi:hypothetical protein